MEEKRPFISIVVVSYNSALTILDTLESIRRQTYFNIELIVTDDCSQDDTVILVKQWIDKYKGRFIRCICLEGLVNVGIAANLNKAIEACNYEYYKTVAGDDMLNPRAIEIYMDYAMRYPKALCISEVELLFGEECTDEFRNEISEQTENAYRRFRDNYKDNKKMYREMLRDNCLPSTGVGILEKSLYFENGAYDNKYPLLEDYPFYLKLVKKGVPIIYIPHPLYVYRIHQDSVSHARQINVEYEKIKIKFFLHYKIRELLKEQMYLELLIQMYSNLIGIIKML